MAERAPRPFFEPQGAAVWCPSPVGISLGRSLAQLDPRDKFLLLFAGPTWFSRLALWMSQLGPTELTECSAAPIGTEGRPEAWKSVPLSRFKKQLQTPWIFEALDEDNLECHIQPILMLSDMTICGFEALARSSVAGRNLNGGDLVTASQAHDLMNSFEVAALRAAARDASPQVLEDEMLFVNLLPSSLGNPDYLEKKIIGDMISRGMDLSRVVFEVIESESLPPLHLLEESIEVIRNSQSIIAIDDVGAGCAAFACIAQIEPDVVKLDKSLLHLEEATACGIIKSLSDCAHSVGALCVAEGIETREQLEMVRFAGVDMAQGWLIGRPNKLAQRNFGGHAFIG